MAPHDDQSTKNDEPDAAAIFLSLTAVIAPVIAAVGALAVTGGIERIQRNEPVWFSVAIGLGVAASAMLALVSTAGPRGFHSSSLAPVIQLLATVLAAFSVMLALGLAISVADDESRPQVNAALTEAEEVVRVSVSASSLQSEDRIAVVAKAILLDPSRKGDLPKRTLYRAFVGPDATGTVEHAFRAGLPAGAKVRNVVVQAFTGDQSPGCEGSISVESLELVGSDQGEIDTAEDEVGGPGTACVSLALSKR